MMAKAKHDAKLVEPIKPVKKSVSISKVFKDAKKKPSRNKDPQQLKPSCGVSKEGGKSPSKQKRKPRLEHPLALAFNANLDTIKQVNEQEVTTALNSTTQELVQRLHNSKESFAKLLEAETEFDKAFYLPLAEEGIEYGRRDGSENSQTTLGAQMKRFQKRVAAEEKELESLWKQWDQVQDELVTAAEDILGIDRPTILAGISTGNLAGVLNSDRDVLETSGADYKRFEELIKSTSEQALEKMVASEKEFTIKQKQRHQHIINLFKDEDVVDE